MNKESRKFGRMLVGLMLGMVLSACAAGQDASKAYSRGMINRGAIVPEENIRVHEYLNYYDQRFPTPTNDPLGLDLRVGNTRFPSMGGEIWLQIGLQARNANDPLRTPLNLALVLDASGSMAASDKMPYLKESLLVFLETLEPEDIVSIVTYDTNARVIRHADYVGNKMWIADAVHQIQPGGQTNLHAGMMLGLAEVDQNFDIRRNNRVLLLTDGIANRGVVDPIRIAEDALTYNEKGIHLSTIGFGLDMNDDLLSKLARQGHGAYHFVDSAQEMEKVFREEADSLVERVANDVRVLVEPAAGFHLQEVTGYDGHPPAGGVEILMQDMGAGDSQVLLARLEGTTNVEGENVIASVTLVYEDAFSQRTRRVTKASKVIVASMTTYQSVVDVEVRRSVTIVRSAEALKQIDEQFMRGEYLNAWQVAHEMEHQLRAVASQTGDQQMVEDADLFNRYQLTLASALGYDPSEEHFNATPELEYGEQSQRWSPEELPTITVE
jgi:Ca-activated chloride channel family protein